MFFIAFLKLLLSEKLNCRLLFIAFLFTFFQFDVFSQVQIGGDIDGENAGDECGYSVSMSDRFTLAVGARKNDGNGTESGQVRVFKRVVNSWVQKGADINGEAAFDLSGTYVSIPDSNTVGIGAPSNSGKGHVRVYKWNGNSWIQKGVDIDGESANDKFGSSISMPDSNTLAVGGFANDGNGNDAGHVRIYSWNGSSWLQKGNDIDGESSLDESGFSVSMPDSNVVAIGARKNDGNGNNSGHVRIYHWNGSSWIQKGSDINGEVAGDLSGTSVSMPDSNTVGIGARSNSDNGSSSGHVRVYKWNGLSWIQKGLDIDGETAGDFSGRSISMPDSNAIAIGARYNSGNGASSGHTRIYKWSGTSWIQAGVDINGESSGDQSGWHVYMPDTNHVVSGALYNNGGGTNSGHARVYSFCRNSADTTQQLACDSLISPSGNYTWTASGTYRDTIINKAGCDSLITINLVVNNTTSDTISPTECDSYTSPSGKSTWSSSGTYLDTISNLAGCDSLLTINLTINKSSSDTISPSVCSTYTSPSGNYIWSASGTYMDTILNSVNCDSVITINLQVQNTTATISPIVCATYTSPSGNYTWTASGTYQDTIANAFGCDSLITIELTVDTINTLVSIFNDSLIALDTNSTYQWLACGSNNYSVIIGATSKIYKPTVNGVYAVALGKLNCTDTSACYNMIISGLKLPESQSNLISVYPNPSNGMITINYPSVSESKNFIITDINGKLIQTGALKKSQTSINLTQLTSGIYILQIEGAVLKFAIE